MADTSESEPPPAERSSADDADVYCLYCGYNLRGLQGDPRRCPECGRWNAIVEGALPDDVVAAELKRVEAGLRNCAGAVYLGMLAGALTLSTMRRPDLGWTWPCFCLPIGFGIVAFVGWVAQLIRFRSACGGRPGWGSALVSFHVRSLWPLLLLVPGVVMVVPHLTHPNYHPGDWALGHECAAGTLLITCTLALWGLFRLVMLESGRTARRMELLYKETAARQARQKLRVDLTFRRGFTEQENEPPD